MAYTPLRKRSKSEPDLISQARALMNQYPRRACFANAHRYVDVNSLAESELLVCYRCGMPQGGWRD